MNAPLRSPAVSLPKRIVNGFVSFVATPASPAPLAVFRIGVSSVLLFLALSVAQNLLDLYGSRGIVQWEVMDGTIHEFLPRLSWVTDTLGRLGVPDGVAVKGVFLIYVTSLSALLVGYRTRWAAIIVYLTHLTMKSSAGATIYGVDMFSQIALFYMIWLPMGATLSLDRAAGRETGEPTALARLGIRVIQLHLCVMYLACGVEKAMGDDWWNGEAIWCALMRSDLCGFDMSWLANIPLLPKLAGLGTLVIEGFYPIFVWPRKTRTAWALATISLHLGIAIFMGLVSFSAMMSVFTGSMFLVSATPGKEWAAFSPFAKLLSKARGSQGACQVEPAV